MSRWLSTPHIVVDVETYSEANLKTVGGYRYAEHPTTRLLCLAYKIDDAPTALWSPLAGEPFPSLLKPLLKDGVWIAHNAAFEKAIWRNVITREYGAGCPSHWQCTMSICAYRSLPLDLDGAGKALRLAIQKDVKGKRLITKLCQPTWKKEEKIEPSFDPTEPDYQALFDYCKRDVDTEHLLYMTLGSLPDAEQRVWKHQEEQNDRGVAVDIDAVDGALYIVEKETEALTAELQRLTDGYVESANQVERLVKWLRKQHVACGGVSKDAVHLLLQDSTISPEVRRVLEIRQALSLSSTAKLQRIRDCLCRSQRVHGMFQYHGAGTGRVAGRLIQLQNLPRGTVKISEDVVKLLKSRDHEAVRMVYGSVMPVVSSALRNMFVAGPGKMLYVADFASIEARVLAWVAGQEDMLQDFREGKDIYCSFASMLYGRTITKADKDERQLGKIGILGAGYGCGATKLQEQARKDYKLTVPLTQTESMVKAYRTGYSQVPALWYGLNDAACYAVLHQDQAEYRGIRYEFRVDQGGTWLACILPSGRTIWYYNPVVEMQETRWGEKPSLTYETRDNKAGRKWQRARTYGGMLTENCISAISRDLLIEAMLRVEKADYAVIASVHDEVVSEVWGDGSDFTTFLELMTIVPSWAKGCPIAAEGWFGRRYHK